MPERPAVSAAITSAVSRACRHGTIDVMTCGLRAYRVTRDFERSELHGDARINDAPPQTTLRDTMAVGMRFRAMSAHGDFLRAPLRFTGDGIAPAGSVCDCSSISRVLYKAKYSFATTIR
jgi:hypothetical protein